MSQAGYNSNASAGNHSMQPSHTQQSMPPPHAGMPYHQQQTQQQQQSSGPYVIGPGQYNNAQQFAYRQQQAGSYQQHQSPTQQQQQQAGRPAFVGINAIPTSSAPRVPTSQHPSSAPYLVQQNSSIRMQQQQQALGGMQQSPSQQSFIQTRMVAVSSAHQQQSQPQLITSGHGQPQLVRVQQQTQQSAQQQQVMQQQMVGANRVMAPGQIQVIATSANSGLVMAPQYTNQGVYQRPLILQQQPIVVQQPSQNQQQTILNAQQQSTQIHYQYKPAQQNLVSQLQQTSVHQQPTAQVSILSKQPAPSPSSLSSSTSSTPAAQFAAPNQLITKSEISSAYNTSPSPASISAQATSAASASHAISDSAAAGSSGVQSDSSQVLTKQRLDDLVREVDPYEQLEDDVKDTLLQIADEFIESVVTGACQIAKHRKANAVDVKDVQLCLERNWNMWIPGFGTDDIRPYKKACVTDAHKQRTALIKKTLKKI